MTQDYVGSFKTRDTELLHYGVKGMKWGIRRDRGGSPKPTRARAKEEAAKARAKQGAAFDARIEKLKGGTGRPLVVNGKKLSTKESIDYLEKQKRKIGIKPEKEVKPAKTSEEKVIDKGTASGNLYNALRAKAAKDGVNSLTDEELTYLNKRNENLIKAQKLVTTPDSWLMKTVKGAVEKAINKNVDQAAEFLKSYGVGQFQKSQEAKNNKSTKSNDSSTKTSSGSSPRSGFGARFRSGARSAKYRYDVFVGTPRSNPMRSRPMITAGPRALEGPVYKVTTL
jgi:hypothetical protein